LRILCRADQSNLRQMATAADKSSVNPNACAWLAFNGRLRRRTSDRRGQATRGSKWEREKQADDGSRLRRESSLEGHVRTILVVPGDKPIEFTLKQTRPEWHHIQHSRAALFQRQDKSLANGNTSGLTHGTSAMTYAVSAAPRSKVGRGELGARVRHQVFGEVPNLAMSWPIAKLRLCEKQHLFSASQRGAGRC
jgi:hypothetical protein